jgi:hypothetical protein
MPQATVGWSDVQVGAGVTALLSEIGKVLVGRYIGKSSVASSFAAADSLWVYYLAQIFLLGAEFIWMHAHEFGSLSHGDKAIPADPQTRGTQAWHLITGIARPGLSAGLLSLNLLTAFLLKCGVKLVEFCHALQHDGLHSTGGVAGLRGRC